MCERESVTFLIVQKRTKKNNYAEKKNSKKATGSIDQQNTSVLDYLHAMLLSLL